MFDGSLIQATLIILSLIKKMRPAQKGWSNGVGYPRLLREFVYKQTGVLFGTETLEYK